MAWGGLSLFVPLFRYAMKCLDKKRIKMKQGETLALNERIMLSLVSTGVSCNAGGKGGEALSYPRWLIRSGPVWTYQGILWKSCSLFGAVGRRTPEDLLQESWGIVELERRHWGPRFGQSIWSWAGMSRGREKKWQRSSSRGRLASPSPSMPGSGPLS